MAKYTITYSCGHVGTESLYGKSSERDRRVEWLEAFGLCQECYDAERQRRREAATDEATRWAADNRLPVLSGSEKQCAWAEKLRREQMATVEKLANGLEVELEGSGSEPFIAEIKAHPFEASAWGVYGDWLEEQGKQQLSERNHAIAWLVSQTEAKWWIDNRYLNTFDLMHRKIDEPKRLERDEQERRRREAEEQRKEQERQEASRREALAALEAKAKLRESQRGWLKRLGELIGSDPASLSLIRAHTNYGWRVLVNEGSDRYSREHLVDYRPKEGVIKTCRELVKKKKDLTAFCVEFWVLNPEKETHYVGSSLFAEEE